MKPTKPLCKNAGECWYPMGPACRLSGERRTSRARCNLNPLALAELQGRHAQRDRWLAAAERAVKGGTP